MRRPTARLLLPLLVAAGIGLAHPWDFGSTAGTAGAGSAPAADPLASTTDLSTLASDLPATAGHGGSDAAAAASPGGGSSSVGQPAVAVASAVAATPSEPAAAMGPVQPLGIGPADALGARPSAATSIAALPATPERRRLQNDLVPADPSTLTGYVWPLPHGRITLPFGASSFGTWLVDGEPFHDGVDLATFCGDRVVAAHAGTVLAAGRHFDRFLGWVGDLGPYFERLDAKNLWFELPIAVVIDDGNTYRSVYAHFSKVVVKAGEHVRAGQLLGYEGRTGNASGCHLHFGIFSQYESATYSTDPGTVKRMKLPALEIARIDPLLVLPARDSPPPAEPPAAELLPPDLTE